MVTGRTNVKRIAMLGLLLAVAMLLSYVEVLIPLPIPIPGVKLGLANLAIVMVLYFCGCGYAFLVSITRIIFTGFLFGNLSMVLYSLAGGVLSLICMSLMMYKGKGHRETFSIKSISLIGGVAHNMGQIMVAYLVVQTYGVFYYVPFLVLSGAVTGFVIGFIFELVCPTLRKIITDR